MARTWGAEPTDRLQLDYGTQTLSNTWAIWARRTGSGGGNFGRMWAIDTNTGVLINGASPTGFWMYRDRFSTSAAWSWPITSANVWHHILITLDFTDTNNDIIPYHDGEVQGSVVREVVGNGPVKTGTLNYAVGNRTPTNNRNFDGDLAEFAVWDRVLNASEAKAVYLYSPLAVPDFKVYSPIWGVHSTEPEWIQGGCNTPAATGTLARANHPPVRPYSARFWRGMVDAQDDSVVAQVKRLLTLMGAGH